MWGFLRLDFRLAYGGSLPLALLYLPVIPLIRGTANLDRIQSAQCLSQSVALLGVILLTPVTRQELSSGTKEMICPRVWTYRKTLLIRISCGFLLLSLLVTGFAWAMKKNNCSFPLGEFAAVTILYAGFLGALGLLLAQLGGHVIAGYLSALGYWSLCQLQIIQENQPLCLFPLVEGKLEIEKLAVLLVLLGAALGGIFLRAAEGFANR